MSYRYHYQKKYGKLSPEIDLHHIIPKHRGGGDELNNLIPCTRIDHADYHLVDYYLYGNNNDLTAYHLLTNYSFDLKRPSYNLGRKFPKGSYVKKKYTMPNGGRKGKSYSIGRDISNEFSIPFRTVMRWQNGESVPQNKERMKAYKELIRRREGVALSL